MPERGGKPEKVQQLLHFQRIRRFGGEDVLAQQGQENCEALPPGDTRLRN